MQFTDVASGQLPSITLDAVKTGTGAINYTVGNALTLGDVTTVYGNGTGGFTFSGPISVTGGLVKQGTSGVTLSGSNSFGGALVRIEGGTLSLGNINAASGAGAIYVPTGGQLGVTASGTFASVPVVLNDYGNGSSNSGGAMRFNLNSANIIWPGAASFADDTQITFYSAGGTYKFTSPMMTGGTLALAAAASNVAATPVIDIETGATLDVSGVTGGCALGTGQTLSGIGTITGALTINGQHQPGVGGNQTFANGVTYGTTAHHVWELLTETTSGAGTSFDQVLVTGMATVKSGAVIDVNLAATGSAVNMGDAFWRQAHTWTILTATSVSGTFAAGTAGSDPAGNPASYYGAFSVGQSTTEVS